MCIFLSESMASMLGPWLVEFNFLWAENQSWELRIMLNSEELCFCWRFSFSILKAAEWHLWEMHAMLIRPWRDEDIIAENAMCCPQGCDGCEIHVARPGIWESFRLCPPVDGGSREIWRCSNIIGGQFGFNFMFLHQTVLFFQALTHRTHAWILLHSCMYVYSVFGFSSEFEYLISPQIHPELP